MKRLIVLRRNEEDNRMYIIEENKFEMTLLSECYDKFGQKIGKENAEDYCLENNYCTELREKFLSDLRVAGLFQFYLSSIKSYKGVVFGVYGE